MPLLHLQLPPGFWSGTGGAIIGSLLSGIIALAAAVVGVKLGAKWTRRRDRETETRNAVGRLNVALIDALQAGLNYLSDNYPDRAHTAVMGWHNAFLKEMPHIADSGLLGRCHELVNWLEDGWVPQLQWVHETLPAPVWDPNVGTHVQNLESLREIAETGAKAIGDFAQALTVWSITGEFPATKDLPVFDAQGRQVDNPV